MTRPGWLLDTNVIVRFPAGVQAEHLDRTRKLLERAEAGELELHIMPRVIAEIVHVLTSFYNIERSAVARTVRTFRAGPGMIVEDHAIVSDALARLASHRVDFADALRAAHPVSHGLPLASFDQDLDRLDDVNRLASSCRATPHCRRHRSMPVPKPLNSLCNTRCHCTFCMRLEG